MMVPGENAVIAVKFVPRKAGSGHPFQKKYQLKIRHLEYC
jgi:hypothetical protein